ncbi:hypothetical protein RE6C_00131 [Rhodopirellula europaea 6C]|uniref:Uncharacterized protein n=1 Tax=Rhodopirellula europaea 6C TaxID=1263867 RepID=M2BBK0_9BACT|nr:hypothetical protein RE6C_00131 [Rhodopirellula europaea 6C]
MVGHAPISGTASLFWSPEQTQNVHPSVGVNADEIVADQQIGTTA